MIRKILVALGISVGAIVSPLPVSFNAIKERVFANHVCDTPWPHTTGTSIDYVTVLCWAGHGYFQAYAYCYSVTWVIDNGVVIDKIKHYEYREGPVKFKARDAIEDNEVARVDCRAAKPFVETKGPLSPGTYMWHET